MHKITSLELLRTPILCFSAAVLNVQFLAPHRSAHFICYSYHFRRLFYSNASALRVDITRYSSMIPVRSERIPFIVHWSVRDVNLNCIYLQPYMMSHSSVRKDVAQRKSINECSEVKVNFRRLSPAQGVGRQWTLCREHVNRNTVHSWSALLTSWLSESGCVN